MNDTNGNGTMPKVAAAAMTLVALVAGIVAVNAPIHAEVSAQRDAMHAIHGQFAELIKELHDDGKQAAYSSGRVDQQIADLRAVTASLGEADKQLDLALQREMRDVNAITEAKLQGLDARLQKELGNTSMLLESSIMESKRELSRNTEFQIQNREKIAGLVEQMLTIQNTIRLWSERAVEARRERPQQ